MENKANTETPLYCYETSFLADDGYRKYYWSAAPDAPTAHREAKSIIIMDNELPDDFEFEPRHVITWLIEYDDPTYQDAYPKLSRRFQSFREAGRIGVFGATEYQ